MVVKTTLIFCSECAAKLSEFAAKLSEATSVPIKSEMNLLRHIAGRAKASFSPTPRAEVGK